MLDEAMAAPYNSNAAAEFLSHYQKYQSYQFFNAIEIRVADTRDTSGGNCCPHGLSSMQEKAILTKHHAVYGSYNLTGYARCKNWESIRISSVEDGEHEAIDIYWNQLGYDREITVMHHDFFPLDLPKRRRISDTEGVTIKT
jgi:hypothetical protein